MAVGTGAETAPSGGPRGPCLKHAGGRRMTDGTVSVQGRGDDRPGGAGMAILGTAAGCNTESRVVLDNVVDVISPPGGVTVGAGSDISASGISVGAVDQHTGGRCMTTVTTRMGRRDDAGGASAAAMASTVGGAGGRTRRRYGRVVHHAMVGVICTVGGMTGRALAAAQAGGSSGSQATVAGGIYMTTQAGIGAADSIMIMHIIDIISAVMAVGGDTTGRIGQTRVIGNIMGVAEIAGVIGIGISAGARTVTGAAVAITRRQWIITWVTVGESGCGIHARG